MANLNLPTAQGGLNLKDSLDMMNERDCIQMDNIIPDVGVDRVRKGFIEISTDSTDILMSFNENGNEQVLTAITDTIFKLNTSTGVRTSLGTGFTTSNWLYTSFTDASGAIHTIMGNGVDIAQKYDGTTLANVGFTIPSGVILNKPLSFKNRMYFVDEGTMDLYYGGVQSISGTLTKFSVAGFFKLGGSIQAIANWTQDAGEGVDDLLVILSSEGEILLYRGISPESSDWSLRGVFRISKPIGTRCLTKLGGDLLIITQQGYFPLSSILNKDRANGVSISDKINPIVEGKDFEKKWSIHWYSKEGWILINAPSKVESYSYEQHILNYKTGAWCRFIGMDAESWLVINDNIYFCNSSGVFEANTGFKDNMLPITYYKQQAYNRFGTDSPKQVLRIKTRYATVGEFEFNKKINIDFKTGREQGAKITSTGKEAIWDEAIWDESFWTDEYLINSFKSGVSSRVGTYVSIGIFGRTNEELSFNSLGILLKVGNGDI